MLTLINLKMNSLVRESMIWNVPLAENPSDLSLMMTDLIRPLLILLDTFWEMMTNHQDIIFSLIYSWRVWCTLRNKGCVSPNATKLISILHSASSIIKSSWIKLTLQVRRRVLKSSIPHQLLWNFFSIGIFNFIKRHQCKYG